MILTGIILCFFFIIGVINLKISHEATEFMGLEKQEFCVDFAVLL